MAKLGKEPKLLIIGAVEYSDTISYFFKDKEIIIHTVNKPEKPKAKKEAAPAAEAVAEAKPAAAQWLDEAA